MRGFVREGGVACAFEEGRSWAIEFGARTKADRDAIGVDLAALGVQVAWRNFR